jgi:predicted ATPase with chaperone activity
MRVACTIADLAGEARISMRALAEAVQYRAYEGTRFRER